MAGFITYGSKIRNKMDNENVYLNGYLTSIIFYLKFYINALKVFSREWGS